MVKEDYTMDLHSKLTSIVQPDSIKCCIVSVRTSCILRREIVSYLTSLYQSLRQAIPVFLCLGVTDIVLTHKSPAKFLIVFLVGKIKWSLSGGIQCSGMEAGNLPRVLIKVFYLK